MDCEQSLAIVIPTPIALATPTVILAKAGIHIPAMHPL